MPFCTHCGTELRDTDIFCAKCGSRQAPAPPGAGAPPPPRPADTPPRRASRPTPADPFSNVAPRTAAILCYIPVVGWIAAIVVLASERFRHDRVLRFHAFQGLYLFVGWLLIQWVFRPLMFVPRFPLGGVLQLGMVAVWIFMIIKTSQDQVYSLPIIGELAERSLSER